MIPSGELVSLVVKTVLCYEQGGCCKVYRGSVVPYEYKAVAGVYRRYCIGVPIVVRYYSSRTRYYGVYKYS